MEFYNLDNMTEIMRMVFEEVQCPLTLHFNEEAANKIIKILQTANSNEEGEEENPELELTDLRNLSDLSADTWNKIADILENMEYNNDIYFKYFIEDFSSTFTDKEGNEIGPILKDDTFYKLIIRSLIDLCSKASYTDHYKLLFDKGKEPEEEKQEEEEEKENEGEEKKMN